MPTTLTLKNIPDKLYDRLRASADFHHRSMNSEAIVCLETILLPTTMSPAERLARVRAVRATSSGKTFNHRDVDAVKREGRS